jgi:dihydrofolate synthase / folylpolyglutamate synthase
MFNHLNDAIFWIENRFKFRPKTDLIKMKNAYDMLNLDLGHIKKIHVAGTNGKGSVASFISHILIENNLKVGTFTSPYLVSFNERIRYQFENISDDDLLNLINYIYDFNEKYLEIYLEPLSFFELLTLMSLIYFHQMNVDVIVMEVGIGGLLDATNILNYDLSLIVSIGYDHMKQLGDTLESIALNKLGILKKNNHLITTVDEKLYELFNDYAKNVGASISFLNYKDITILSYNPITYLYKGIKYQLNLLGNYQILNSLLSIEAVFYLYPTIDTLTVQKALLKAKWDARLEKIAHHVYLDGAHNIDAIISLGEIKKSLFHDKKVYVIFSALKDKDISLMLNELKKFSHEVILTSFEDERFDLDELKKYPFLVIEDFMKSYQYVLDKFDDDSVLMITGSLHFAGYVKKLALSNKL